MRLFRPPFVGFKIFISDFNIAHFIRPFKKNISMAWNIVSRFVHYRAEAGKVFTAQFPDNGGAIFWVVVVVATEGTGRPCAVFAAFGPVRFEWVSPFRRAIHAHGILRLSPAFHALPLDTKWRTRRRS